MPDTFVQDILDPEEIEKRTAWNKRMDLPIMVHLDDYFQKNNTSQTLLSGEFVHKINPDSFRLENNLTEEEPADNSCFTFSLLIDGTGHKNDLPDNVLPINQLVINRKKYNDLELFISRVMSLGAIPFSDRGIGKRSKDQDFGFSQTNPFYIFVCAYNDSELRQYMNEVLKISKDFPENLLKVVGFLAPKVG